MNTLPSIATTELSSAQRDRLAEHLLALDAEARRLRFGVSLTDEAIRAYVDAIDFERNVVFVAFDAELRIAGAAHLFRGEDGAELGISVLAEQRGRGIGQALLARAQLHARNCGIDVLFMHCLAENETMRHLARKQGMAVAVERGEASARVELAPGNVSTAAHEFIAEHVGLFDFALKAHVLSGRRLAEALVAAGASGGPAVAEPDTGTGAAAAPEADAVAPETSIN